MGQYLKLAFSLIELMVVIAIIAVLAAVAVPAYKSYSVKAKIIGPFQIIDKLAQEIKIHYQNNGAYPTSVTINNIAVPLAAWTNVSGGNNYNGIYGVAYQISPDGKGAMISASLTGLSGIPDYVTPGVLGYGTATNLMYGVREIGSEMRSECGGYILNHGSDIPEDYRPKPCTCDSVNSFHLTGAC